MPADSRLVIASNRLPFTVQRVAHALELQPTSGGLASALASVHRQGENVWVGWPGDCSGLDAPLRADLLDQLRRARVVPVDLSGGELVDYYDGVCNSVLWPVLHYMLDRLPVVLPEFRAYRAINERFAEALAATWREGDTVWIHDYHLLLAPAMVRARVPNARIGFFLHTPFPAADVFRVLPWRRELLDGMLGATLVGFQTAGDAANFAGAVRMFTDYLVEDGSIIADGRQIRFGAYAIGIEPQRLETAEPVPGTASCAVLSHRGTGRRLLAGVDRLDYTKGILRRLAAFEQLLADEPHLQGGLELLQIAVPSRELVPSYVLYRRQVQEHVAGINSRFGTPAWTPVHYVEQSVSPFDLRAIYRAADVMLVTSLRDGMNLVAKEFVSSRTDEDGVLILSEMAGAAEELTDALIVNPYAVEELAAAIATALTLDRGERGRRMRSMREQIAERTVGRWVARFVDDLTAAAAPEVRAGDRAVAEIVLTAIAGRQPVSMAFVYEEALVDGVDSGASASPDPELLDLLRELATRSTADLHVVSSLDHALLGRWFDMVPVTIWAESGLWRRERDERRWRRAAAVPTSWIADVREFLDHFTARTPGAFVEERSSHLVWQFGRADRITGRTQAQILFALLRDAASGMGFSVRLGPSAIELRPAGLTIERAIGRLRDTDAVASRLVIVQGAGARPGIRDSMRQRDVLVTVGPGDDPAATAVRDIRALRDVMQSVIGSLPPATRRLPAFAARLRNAAAVIAGAAAPGDASTMAVRTE